MLIICQLEKSENEEFALCMFVGQSYFTEYYQAFIDLKQNEKKMFWILENEKMYSFDETPNNNNFSNRLFSWAVWHSCRMGARNQEQTRGRIGPQLRLGNLRVGELHFCPLSTALNQVSSLSR